MKEAKKTIGEIVAEDYRTAKVFEEYGIDFCCGGKGTLAAACIEKGVDPAALIGDLQAVKSQTVERGHNYSSWELSFLADYIVNVHHNYLNENTTQIAAYLHKIADIHGAKHPEVVAIASIFDRIAPELSVHLGEEENAFFPAIKRVDIAKKTGATPAGKDLETISHSLEKLVQEHEDIGEAIHEIHHLAKGYSIPDAVCNTFVVTYRKLKEFEADLHKHVHLENNILFPRAKRLLER